MARGRINDRTTANSTINSIGTDSEQRRREQKLEQLREQLAKERLNRLHELEKQLQTATNQQVIADLKQRRLQVEQDIADIQSALTLEIANEQYEEELTNKIKLLETARAFEKDIIKQKAVEEQLLELQKEKYVLERNGLERKFREEEIRELAAARQKDLDGKLTNLNLYSATQRKLDAERRKKDFAERQKDLLTLAKNSTSQADRLAAYQTALAEQKAEYEKTLRTDQEEYAYNLQKSHQDKMYQIEVERTSSRLKETYRKQEEAAQRRSNLTSAQYIVDTLGSTVDKYLGVYSKYYTSITTRLQNSGLDYEKINKTYRAQAAANPYFEYKSLLDNLSRLVEAGIADNVAQRAFLGTISEKVASTFDAATASMLSIIRIQQQDSTASRLGLEANLTRMLNSYFQDTSYLNNLYDTVQSALIDTSASFGDYRASIEFEYQVQKWLGSLGAVGVTDSTLSSIAQGINALATGDVGYLSSNTAMQNLLVMASNRTGLSYSKMLASGVSSTEVNTLLRGVVEYIQTILQSNNNVVKKQYSELFGVTISDLAAFSNLTNDTINSLYKTTMSYNDTLSELDYQLKQVAKRTHISTMVDNVIENTMMSVGIGVANNAATYGLYKAADLLEKITGGVQLPFVSVMGSGMDLNMTLESLVKTGILGFSSLGTLVGAIGNISKGGFLDPNKYVVQSGSGRGFTGYASKGELIQTTSSTTVVSNTSATGTSQSLYDQQAAAGKEVRGEEDDNSEMENKYFQPYLDYFSAIVKILKEDTVSVRVTEPIQMAGAYGSAGLNPTTAQTP